MGTEARPAFSIRQDCLLAKGEGDRKVVDRRFAEARPGAAGDENRGVEIAGMLLEMALVGEGHRAFLDPALALGEGQSFEGGEGEIHGTLREEGTRRT